MKKKPVYSVVLVWPSPNDIFERPIISQLFADFQIKKKKKTDECFCRISILIFFCPVFSHLQRNSPLPQNKKNEVHIPKNYDLMVQKSKT